MRESLFEGVTSMSDYYNGQNWYGNSAEQTTQSGWNTLPPEKNRKKHKAVEMTTKKVVTLALCCSLIGGGLGFGGASLIGSSGQNQNSTTVLEGQRTTAAINVAQIDTSKELTPAENYAANVGSTVGITTEITTNFWGFQTTSAASGSGFILTADGYILTNYHVVEGSNSIKVTTYDDTAYDAMVVGYDESNDIAVLKIDAQGLTPVVLGDSDTMNVGDTVMAIGNPLGELTFSQTVGTVSALDREVTFSNGLTMDLIQTDCAINSGNSGGALFNSYGEVVGITNAKSSGNGSSSSASVDNIGFAIPINHVRGIVESIIEKGYIAKPFIGVSVMDVSEETQSYGLPQGAAVKAVTEDSPAEKAGLQINDIITKANDTEITESDDLVDLVKSCEPGDSLLLTVYRSGDTLELTVTVAERQQTALANEATEDTENNQQDFREYFFGIH